VSEDASVGNTRRDKIEKLGGRNHMLAKKGKGKTRLLGMINNFVRRKRLKGVKKEGDA